MSIRTLFRSALLAVLATAAAHAEDANLLGLPPKAVKAGGKLLLGGGGELPEEVYDRFVEMAGGENARLVLIPTAYPFDGPAHYRRYYGGWLEYKVKSFQFLDTDSRDEADTDRFVRSLQNATGVWIGGGAQGRLVDIYGGTKVEAALRGVLERGGIIGGTSAGASVVSKCMIRSGPHTEANCSDGLGFLANAIVDQHFSQRGRHTRLLGCLKDHPECLCIGLDEGAAVLVEGNSLQSIGDSTVTVLTSRQAGKISVLYHLDAGDAADVMRFSLPGTESDLGLMIRKPRTAATGD